jgi:AcrR family transcriptional regulator
MAVDPVPHGVDDRVERPLVGGQLVGSDAGDDRRDRVEDAVDGGAEQLVLAREVVVDGGHDDVGLLGDVADRRVDVSLAGEEADRRVDHVVAARRPVRRGRRWWRRALSGLFGHSCGRSPEQARCVPTGDRRPTLRSIDARNTTRRPAHRPSRRTHVVDGAMGLFATMPVDEVTVQDIANSVEMTSAAVYYHFASKEEILLEGMRNFRDDLLAEIRDQLPALGDPAGIRNLVAAVLRWTGRHRADATVYFVNSIGLNLLVEALRRDVRLELIDVLREAVAASRPDLDSAEEGVIAVALVSLIETAIASMLNEDVTYRSLGARRYPAEVGRIGDRIAGVAPAD